MQLDRPARGRMPLVSTAERPGEPDEDRSPPRRPGVGDNRLLPDCTYLAARPDAVQAGMQRMIDAMGDTAEPAARP